MGEFHSTQRLPNPFDACASKGSSPVHTHVHRGETTSSVLREFHPLLVWMIFLVIALIHECCVWVVPHGSQTEAGMLASSSSWCCIKPVPYMYSPSLICHNRIHHCRPPARNSADRLLCARRRGNKRRSKWHQSKARVVLISIRKSAIADLWSSNHKHEASAQQYSVQVYASMVQNAAGSLIV